MYPSSLLKQKPHLEHTNNIKVVLFGWQFIQVAKLEAIYPPIVLIDSRSSRTLQRSAFKATHIPLPGLKLWCKLVGKIQRNLAMTSKASSRADINLLRYDGTRGRACETFMEHVKLFKLEDKRHSDAPLTDEELLEYMELQAPIGSAFAQFLTAPRLKRYKALPAGDIMSQLLEDVAREFSYSSVEEAHTLVNMKMDASEDPLRFGRRFEEQYERARAEFADKASVRLFLQGLPEPLRAAVKAKQTTTPTLDNTIKLAQFVYEQAQEDKLLDQFPSAASKPGNTVVMAAAVGEDNLLSEMKQLRGSCEKVFQEMRRLKQQVDDMKCAYCYSIGHGVDRCRIRNPALAVEGWEPKTDRLKQMFYENKAKMGLLGKHQRATHVAAPGVTPHATAVPPQAASLGPVTYVYDSRPMQDELQLSAEDAAVRAALWGV